MPLNKSGAMAANTRFNGHGGLTDEASVGHIRKMPAVLADRTRTLKGA
jgi:hypothetical protein